MASQGCLLRSGKEKKNINLLMETAHKALQD